MKFKVLHALSVLASAVNNALGKLEAKTFYVANDAMNKAHDAGIAIEQRIINDAKSEVEAARRKLEAANAKAQAALKAYPQRLADLRAKVFG